MRTISMTTMFTRSIVPTEPTQGTYSTLQRSSGHSPPLQLSIPPTLPRGCLAIVATRKRDRDQPLLSTQHLLRESCSPLVTRRNEERRRKKHLRRSIPPRHHPPTPCPHSHSPSPPDRSGWSFHYRPEHLLYLLLQAGLRDGEKLPQYPRPCWPLWRWNGLG